MLFELKVECTFSRELEQVKTDVGEAMARAEPLLLKGAPVGREAEAAKIKSWQIDGKKLELVIVSGRYVRAHDALLRLTKVIGAELGKKHKIGLRKILAREYRVTLPTGMPPDQARQLLAELPCKVEIEGQNAVLILRDLNEAALRGHVVDRLIAIAETALKGVPPPTAPKVVKEGEEIEHPFREDPLEVAKRLGWVAEFPGRGQWIYTAPYAKLLQALEDLIIDRIALKLGFEEVLFPKLIPLEVMQKMPGYLDELPEGMYYVCPPPREPEVFVNFKRKLKLTKRLPLDELRKCLKEPTYVLAPAQCEPFYEYFSRKRVKVEDMPIKFFDRSGWTYRWEGGGVEGIIRTQEFRRIEFVFIGRPEDVIDIRDAVRDKSIELASELGLRWRLLVATPFYMREGGIEEDITDSRKVATYDLEVKLPYKDDWLEIA
ncbi:MAG: serine--tRNA ligase, partial [Hadesarchaea archaeon]|nr:serine--tRNA ligase [Hadesarchaea archaeon]